jgi:hypothetical protein
MDRHQEALEGAGVHAMRNSKFSEEQMAYALMQAELGSRLDGARGVRGRWRS